MKPEEKARQKIDRMLEAAGWTVQDVQELNLGASPGVTVREFPMKSGAADYLLFADRTALGVVEAKPEGTTLSGVADQSGKYIGTSFYSGTVLIFIRFVTSLNKNHISSIVSPPN